MSKEKPLESLKRYYSTALKKITRKSGCLEAKGVTQDFCTALYTQMNKLRKHVLDPSILQNVLNRFW